MKNWLSGGIIGLIIGLIIGGKFYFSNIFDGGIILFIYPAIIGAILGSSVGAIRDTYQ